MFKYLAGIFANPRNDYADKRLTMPLTKKMGFIRSPQSKKSSQVNISLKTIINGGRLATIGKGKLENREQRRRRDGNPQVPRSKSRSSLSQKFTNVQMDPISYIVNVADSSSSHEEKEIIPQISSEPKPLEDQDTKAYCQAKKENNTYPVPPPVSRVQSFTGPFNANPFNERDDLSTWKKYSTGEDEDPMAWEMYWLPEEFWSANSDSASNK
ncbi:uncharacterized protein LOC108111848 [Drosophila eugracilis]|uniref:uncharacterized protein LOC108111848 n=1 Tax=Drosophila eugracilis TaxID=29029 RepID=UPI0007E679A8|nr:uncharacterized protein LOC108111848 [Drosophila eugracilis]